MFKSNMDNIWSLRLLFEVYTGIGLLGKNDLIALTGGTDYVGILITF